MCKAEPVFNQNRPTQRAPDAGALRVARFQAFFYASAFSQSDSVPPPNPARVTQTVGRREENIHRLHRISVSAKSSERITENAKNLYQKTQLLAR